MILTIIIIRQVRANNTSQATQDVLSNARQLPIKVFVLVACKYNLLDHAFLDLDKKI